MLFDFWTLFTSYWFPEPIFRHWTCHVPGCTFWNQARWNICAWISLKLYELPGNPGSPTRSFVKYPSYKLAEKQGLVIKHNPRMLGKSALNLHAARHWSLLPPHAVNAKSARAVGSDNATASAKLGRCDSLYMRPLEPLWDMDCFTANGSWPFK